MSIFFRRFKFNMNFSIAGARKSNLTLKCTFKGKCVVDVP